MVYDNRPNLTNNQFDQKSDDVLCLKGCIHFCNKVIFETGNTFTILNNKVNGGILQSDSNGLITIKPNFGWSNLSTKSTIIGFGNISSGSTSIGNTVLGVETLKNISTGCCNIGVGYRSQYHSTSSCYNIGIGNNTLCANNGCYNIAIGDNTLCKNCAGNQNIGIGQSVLICNRTGLNNIGIGELSLYFNTGGTSNIGIGKQSLIQNRNGCNNIGVGDYSLYNNLSCNNIGIGLCSLYSNQLGSNSIAIGNFAGRSNISGTGSTFIGLCAGYLEAGNNKLYIDNTGTEEPLIYGEFDNNILKINGDLFVKNVSGGVCTDSILTWNPSTCLIRRVPYVSGYTGQSITGATNGLTKTANKCVILGGTLTQNTSILGNNVNFVVGTTGASIGNNLSISNLGTCLNVKNLVNSCYSTIEVKPEVINITLFGSNRCGLQYSDNYSNIFDNYDRSIPDVGWVRANGGVGYSGNTVNGVTTYINQNKMCSNPNLTFNGSTLCLVGNAFITGLTNTQKTNALYYDDITGEITYGIASTGTSTPLTLCIDLKNNIYTCNSGFNNSNIDGKNIIFGYLAGYSNIDGCNNLFLGTCAGYSETGSSKLYIANTASNPLICGDFSTNVLRINGNLGLCTTPYSKFNIHNPVGGTSSYIQYSNVATGLAGTGDGTLTGLDSSGNFIINQQENLSVLLYTNNTLALTVDNSQKATFAGQTQSTRHYLSSNSYMEYNSTTTSIDFVIV